MMDGLGGHGWGMGLGMGWWWIFGIALFALVIWLSFKYAKKRDPRNQPGYRSPMEILEDRYARGEIDKEEFEERKKHLL